MKGKITLFNPEGKHVGDTFARRARQLVGQQRARWMDEERTAIQFFPDLDEEFTLEGTTLKPDEDIAIEESTGIESPHTIGSATEKPSVLYKLAEKKLDARKKLIIHTLLLVPVAFAIFFTIMVLFDGLPRNESFGWFFFGASWSSWFTFYICHARGYFKKYGSRLHTSDTIIGDYMQTRRERNLAVEVARLRRMGFTD